MTRQTQQQSHQHGWRTISIRNGISRQRESNAKSDTGRYTPQPEWLIQIQAGSGLEETAGPGSKFDSGSMATN